MSARELFIHSRPDVDGRRRRRRILATTHRHRITAHYTSEPRFYPLTVHTNALRTSATPAIFNE